jgi:hypothetical protein
MVSAGRHSRPTSPELEGAQSAKRHFDVAIDNESDRTRIGFHGSSEARVSVGLRLPRKRKISNSAAFDAGREPRQGCTPWGGEPSAIRSTRP